MRDNEQRRPALGKNVNALRMVALCRWVSWPVCGGRLQVEFI